MRLFKVSIYGKRDAGIRRVSFRCDLVVMAESADSAINKGIEATRKSYHMQHPVIATDGDFSPIATPVGQDFVFIS